MLSSNAPGRPRGKTSSWEHPNDQAPISSQTLRDKCMNTVDGRSSRHAKQSRAEPARKNLEQRHPRLFPRRVNPGLLSRHEQRVSTPWCRYSGAAASSVPARASGLLKAKRRHGLPHHVLDSLNAVSLTAMILDEISE